MKRLVLKKALFKALVVGLVMGSLASAETMKARTPFPGTVVVTVRDSLARSPVAGARVLLVDDFPGDWAKSPYDNLRKAVGYFDAVTDSRGVAKISDLRPGRFRCFACDTSRGMKEGAIEVKGTRSATLELLLGRNHVRCDLEAPPEVGSRLRLVPSGPPADTSATPSPPSTLNAGHVVLKIRGNVEDIVLVDPLGRADRDSAGEPLAGIPGCSRWDGGIEEDMEDTTSSGEPDLMVFEMASSMFGRYTLSMRAPQPMKVTIVATLDSRVPGVPPCVDLTRLDSVGVGRHCWTLDVRQDVPAGECGMRISPMTRGCGH